MARYNEKMDCLRGTLLLFLMIRIVYYISIIAIGELIGVHVEVHNDYTHLDSIDINILIYIYVTYE